MKARILEDPAIAYDSNNERFLLYYWKNGESRGQFLNINGQPTGDDFYFIDNRPAHLIFNEEQNKFLIFYNRNRDGVKGQTVNDFGELIGGPFLIADDAWWNYPI